MLNFGNKEFRSLMEQVLANANDILTLKQEGMGHEPVPGPEGPKGDTGVGEKGERGNAIFGVTEKLPPVGAYKDGDMYLLTNGNLFKRVSTGSKVEWRLQTSIKGPAGVPGPAGGDSVVPNPAAEPSDTLRSIKINGVTYDIYNPIAVEQVTISDDYDLAAIYTDGTMDWVGSVNPLGEGIQINHDTDEVELKKPMVATGLDGLKTILTLPPADPSARIYWNDMCQKAAQLYSDKSILIAKGAKKFINVSATASYSETNSDKIQYVRDNYDYYDLILYKYNPSTYEVLFRLGPENGGGVARLGITGGPQIAQFSGPDFRIVTTDEALLSYITTTPAKPGEDTTAPLVTIVKVANTDQFSSIFIIDSYYGKLYVWDGERYIGAYLS